MSAIEREVERFCAILIARGRGRAHVRRYRNDLADLVAFLHRHGKDDLREATEGDVAAFLVALDGRYARSTVNLKAFRLRKLLNYLQRSRVLLRNPASDLQRKHAPSRVRDWLSEDEIALLLESVATHDALRHSSGQALGLRDRALLELYYSSGLRLDEARSLELDDLDLADGLVTVAESKSGRGRRVPMGTHAIHWLRRYLKEGRPQLTVKTRRTLAVFLSQQGSKMGKETIAGRIRHYVAQAGIEKHVTAHVFRHSFAVHLLKHGASTRHIQEMLGHRSLQATQIYLRLLPADLKEAHRRSHPTARLPDAGDQG